MHHSAHCKDLKRCMSWLDCSECRKSIAATNCWWKINQFNPEQNPAGPELNTLRLKNPEDTKAIQAKHLQWVEVQSNDLNSSTESLKTQQVCLSGTEQPKFPLVKASIWKQWNVPIPMEMFRYKSFLLLCLWLADSTLHLYQTKIQVNIRLVTHFAGGLYI